MTETDWGDIDNLPPTKKGFPKWILFCGCGCLIPILLLMAGVGWGVSWFNTGQDVDVQIERLREVIPFDDAPQSSSDVESSDGEAEHVARVGEFRLIFGQRIPFIEMDIFLFVDPDEDGDIEQPEYFCMLMQPADDETAQEFRTSQQHGSDTEEVTLVIQGREIEATRGSHLGEMPFPGMPQGESGASIVMDLSQDDAEHPLVFLMIHQNSEDAITQEEVERFLAPFHIGPDR
jgi:hypothetical protein